jgi:hypothetical protein
MNPNLEAKTVDSASILISEYNLNKHTGEDDTFQRVRTAIESGDTSQIPPIVALQNPFGSIEETIQAYQAHTRDFPRHNCENFEHEDEVLGEILKHNYVLCYNGNRRLEEHQKAKIPINTFVITSQEEYALMPKEERRIPEKPESMRPEVQQQYEIDQNYVSSYLAILDEIVRLQAKKKHYDSFDAKKELSNRRLKTKKS